MSGEDSGPQGVRILAVLLALLGCSCGALPPPGSARVPVARLSAATVALTDPLGEPFCAGVFVGQHYVATAAHCVLDEDGEQEDEVAVGLFGDMVRRKGHDAWDLTYRATIAYVSEAQDVAILRVGASPDGLPVRFGDRPVAGDRALALGHPFGLCYTPTDGLVARNHVGGIQRGQVWLQVSAPAAPEAERATEEARPEPPSVRSRASTRGSPRALARSGRGRRCSRAARRSRARGGMEARWPPRGSPWGLRR